MYYPPSVLYGDQIVTALWDIRGGLRECHLFEPIYNPYPTPTFWGNLYVAPPVYAPWSVFSLGTWDGGYNYYDYYNLCRTRVSYWAPPRVRRPPRTIWYVPRVNYSAAYNVVRMARKWRDPFIYLNSPDYGWDGVHKYMPSANGLRALARHTRYLSNCWVK
jgi:hypothetical protein